MVSLRLKEYKLNNTRGVDHDRLHNDSRDACESSFFANRQTCGGYRNYPPGWSTYVSLNNPYSEHNLSLPSSRNRNQHSVFIHPFLYSFQILYNIFLFFNFFNFFFFFFQGLFFLFFLFSTIAIVSLFILYKEIPFCLSSMCVPFSFLL